MPRRLQLEHQNHSNSQIQREPTCLTHLRNKSFASSFVKVSEIRPRFVVRNMVSEIRPQFVVRNMLRHDPRSSHAKMTPIRASKQLRFTNTTRTDVFDTLAQQVFWLVIREGFGDPTAICRLKYVKTRSTLLPCQDKSNWSIKTTPVSEIRPRFVIRDVLGHDPRSSHAKTTPIGASKLLRFANTTRTDVFDSPAQQVFCHIIRKGFLDPTAICRPKYVKT
ncbi:uncharacterized protein G2W53_028693 [Senna tora]|uniref:Uncharacterized protein n=1 Tax=Senna tora TaxID=362788 RepID=A0A834TCR7_9FABA|nr:uncharacterized protein G2W53_028693 [Senna tora]